MSYFLMRPSFLHDDVHADADSTLNEIVRRHPQTLLVLRHFQIVSDEPGTDRLATIAQRHHLDLAVLLRALNGEPDTVSS